MNGLNNNNKLECISGWILPDGVWRPCEDWWHISVLYDLRDGGYECLCTPETLAVLKGGEEETIRNHVARLGFIRISRKMLDGYSMNIKQLRSLQEILELCDPETELEIIGPSAINNNRIFIRVEKILKLKNPAVIFDKK